MLTFAFAGLQPQPGGHAQGEADRDRGPGRLRPEHPGRSRVPHLDRQDSAALPRGPERPPAQPRLQGAVTRGRPPGPRTQQPPRQRAAAWSHGTPGTRAPQRGARRGAEARGGGGRRLPPGPRLLRPRGRGRAGGGGGGGGERASAGVDAGRGAARGARGPGPALTLRPPVRHQDLAPRQGSAAAAAVQQLGAPAAGHSCGQAAAAAAGRQSRDASAAAASQHPPQARAWAQSARTWRGHRSR